MPDSGSFCGDGCALERLEQPQIAVAVSKARSKPSIESTGAPHSAGFGTAAQTSPIPTFAGLPVVLGLLCPVEARCKEIRLVAGCAGDQNRWVCRRKGLERIARPSSGHTWTLTPTTFPPVAPSCRRRRCTQSGD
jgi:hypothetical protein